MTNLLAALHLLALTTSGYAHRLLRPAGRPAAQPESGASTLEVVVIALGLFLVAGLLVAAITAAVTNRLGQLQ